MVWLVYKADFAQHAWLLPPSSKFAELQIRLTLFYTYNDFWSILQNNLHFLNHFLNLKLDLSLILSPIVSFFPQSESAGHQSSAQARFKDCNAQQIADWIKGHESTPLRLDGGKVSNPDLYLCWWCCGTQIHPLRTETLKLLGVWWLRSCTWVLSLWLSLVEESHPF